MLTHKSSMSILQRDQLPPVSVAGMVVMGATLSGLQHQHSLNSLKALRTLRALRPLRVASRLEGMKVIVNSLFASLPALANVLLVSSLVYLIFGIMAVDLLGVSAGLWVQSCPQIKSSTSFVPHGYRVNPKEILTNP